MGAVAVELTKNALAVWEALVLATVNRFPVVKELLPIVNGFIAVEAFQLQVWAKSPFEIPAVLVAAVKPLKGTNDETVDGADQAEPFHTNSPEAAIGKVLLPTINGKVDTEALVRIKRLPGVALDGELSVTVAAEPV